MKKIDTSKTVNELHNEQMRLGDRIADTVASAIGSWSFIIVQAVLMVIWFVLNSLVFFYHWDSYPFVFLNLAMSAEAAFSAPVIMMSQNRQATKDRIVAEHDYATNEAAKLEIEQLVKLVIAQHEAQNEHLDAQDKLILQMVENRRPRK